MSVELKSVTPKGDGVDNEGFNTEDPGFPSVRTPLWKNTLLYYRKLYYMKRIFSTKLEPIKIPFSIWKLTLFFILILMDVLEY